MNCLYPPETLLPTDEAQRKVFLESWFRCLGAVLERSKHRFTKQQLYELIVEARQKMYNDHVDPKVLLWE